MQQITVETGCSRDAAKMITLAAGFQCHLDATDGPLLLKLRNEMKRLSYILAGETPDKMMHIKKQWGKCSRPEA